MAGHPTRDFPLFPLGLVALPGEMIPLHIFEERYKTMIQECLEGEREFGIVWLSDDGLREVGCACAIVSTPYVYATEALAEGRGLLAEFGNPESIARCVNLYLDDPVFRRRTEERAFAYGREMAWARGRALCRAVPAGRRLITQSTSLTPCALGDRGGALPRRPADRMS